MKHIVYLSQAVHPLSDQQLEALLTQCQRDNARTGITGILFYSHGHIAQLFEGEPEIVDALFERIARDGRHSHVQKLVERPITVRSFADWAMAFHPLQPAAFSALQAFLSPSHLPPVPASLSIADATLLELVRLAVLGITTSHDYLQAFTPGAPTDTPV
jgi:Sensors of blue-light using FAD